MDRVVSRRPVAVVLAATALLAGCSPDEGSPVPADTDPAAAFAAEAHAAGADEAQVAALTDGEVTYAEYEAAMNRSFECMRTQGFQVDVKGARPYNGVTILEFEVGGTNSATNLDTEAGRALLEDCNRRHSSQVESFWQAMSPDAVAYNERRDAALSPLLRECLDRNDVDLAEDASMHDMIAAATDLLVRTDGTDCVTEIGYPTWDG